MPDFEQQPQLPQLPQIPTLQDTSVPQKPPVLTPLDKYNQAVQNVNSNLPDWAKDSNSQFLTPFKTRLDQTLRYNDPNIGFNPTDNNLEDTYAHAHWLKTFGNNLLQGGARFLGTAAETIATIPLAMDAAINKDFSKLYDNDLTNGIHQWLNTLDTTLPVYQTNFERDHPILKYLNPLKPLSLLGSWGNAFNNFGFTAGAIAGAMVEDAVITSITGGLGFFPALAANGAQLTKLLGRASRAVAAAPGEIKNVLKAGELVGEAVGSSAPQEVSTVLRNRIGEGLQDVGHGINSQNVQNFDEILASQKVNELKTAIKNNAQYFKIRDAVKYNLAMLTSAASEASFEAVDVYHRGLDQLKQQYFEEYGTVPIGEELDNIKRISHQSANVDMAGNIAFLYMMNRINWGSLFKPTTTAFDEAITGWGGSIARSTVKKEASDAGNVIYRVAKDSPATRIDKILLNGEKAFKIGYRSISEAIEEGSQFIMSEGAMDYNLRKYKAQHRGEIVDGMQSFIAGVDKTFNTNEGWDNMMGGFIGGIFGTGIMGKIMEGRGQTTAEKQMAIQANLLNSYNFNGTFENKLQEAAVQSSLAEEHKTAVENQDKLSAKNIKFEMLYNWVTSGIRANSFDRRIEELDAVRDLEGKSFQDYWGKSDNAENRLEIDAFLDDIIRQSNNIKNHYTRIDGITHNPYDAKKDAVNHEAFESYKDQLALNLSKSDNYRERIMAMQEELRRSNPLLDIQKALNLTNINGLRETLNGIDKAQVDLDEQIKLAKETEADKGMLINLINKRKGLNKIFSELQPLVINTKTDEHGNVIEGAFNGKDYIDTLQKLYDLHDGSSFLNNKYIRRFEKQTIFVDNEGTAKIDSHDELADHLQTLQDIYKLSQANLNVQRFYNFLRKGVGATEFMSQLKTISLENLKKYMGTEQIVKTPEQIKEDIEEEVRSNIPEPEDIEEADKQQRDIITRAAKKIVSGDKLTEEEQKLTEEKPSRFAHEVKIQQDIQEKINQRFSEETTDNEIKPTPRSKIKVKDLFGLFSQDKNDIKHRTNLYNAIFKSKDGVFNKLKAFYTEAEPQDIQFTKIPNTEIYRKSFDEKIEIFHDGNQIGILRPQNSLWIDEEGKRSIYDMKQDEFTQLTGHPEDQYDNFMKELRDYQKAYNDFKEAILKTKDKQVDFDEINKYFDLSINPGASVQNRYTIVQEGEKFNVIDPRGNVVQRFDTLRKAQGWVQTNNNTLSRYDTLLKDLKYKPKGTALVSFVTNIDAAGRETTETNIVNRDDLTQEQIGKIEHFLAKNHDNLVKNSNRYVLLLPINDEYQRRSVIFARNADTTQQDRENFFSKVKDVANGIIAGDKLNETINELANQFFIANQDRTTKQVFINLLFTEDGDLILDINNPTNKVYKRIELDKGIIQNTNSYGELMKNLQSQINNESQKDRHFARLAVQINEDSLKRQIPDDENITKLSQVNSKLKVATTPEVFTNYNINFTPKGYGETVSSETTTETPSTPGEESLFPKQTVEEKAATEAIKEEYRNKRLQLQAEFTKSLTPAEARIKKELRANYQLAKDIPSLAKLANVTVADVQSYSKKAAIYNEQFRIYEDIQKQKLANPTKTDVAIYAKTKAGVETIAKDLFNLSNEEANAVAEIFDANAQAWSSRTGNSVADYYKQLGFKSRLEEDINSPNILEQYPAIQKVIDYLKLKPKRISINKIGYVSENGSVGLNLANRIGEVIKEQGLQDLVAARWNKTDGAIEFYPIDKQGRLFQIAGIEGIKNVNPKLLSENLASAEEFEKEGEDPKLIYALTGWERGKDGKWRYDLNDKFTFKPKALDTLSKEGSVKLKDLINNPTLFKAYPYLEDLSVLKSFNTDGYAHTVNSILLRKANFEDLQLSEFPEANNQLYTTLVHEIQHAIQAIEGFERGGNTKTFEEENNEIFLQLQKFERERNKLIYIDNLNRNSKNEDKIANLSNQINKLTESITGSNNSPFGKYYRLAGEVEARNAQMRYSFSPELSRNTPISKTEGISRDDQIIGKSIVAISKNENSQNAKAAYDKLTNTIYALTNPDVTSPLHELAHSWEPLLNDEEKQTVLDWAKTPEWTRETSEKFANGFELYLAEGNAPTTALEAIFKQFAKWLGDVIKKVQTLFGKDFALNNEMRTIYANMLNAKLVKEKVEGVIKTEQLTADNIHFEEQEDGSNKIFVKDNNGNVIKNPNTEDGSFKLQEAKDFIKEYNKKFEPSKTEQPIEETVPVEEVKQSEEQKGPEILKPLNENEKTDYGKISQIQKDLSNGFYEEQLKNKTLTPDELKGILKSAGLRESIVDGMMFRIENPDLIKSLSEGVPKGINISYLRSDLNKAIKDGRFGEAIRNGELSIDKAKQILKYFHINENKFKDDFEAAQAKIEANITPTETTPLTREDMDFINVLKQHINDLTGIYGNVLKDRLDVEDYAGLIDDVKNFLAANTKQAKEVFNNPETYKAFLALTKLEEGATEAEQVKAQHADVFEPEPEQPKPEPKKYVTYKTKDEQGNVIERPAVVVEDNGFTSLIETPTGERFDRITEQLHPSTKEAFDALKPAKPKPTSIENAKYNIGDKVIYGQDKKEYTIAEAETRPNDKGVPETYYITEEGPLISESGIRELARQTRVTQQLQVKKEYQKRQDVLTRIAKRFQQVFPDIKYEIGEFDFNAPARFNKGIVEINVGYNFRKYSREEINQARFENILNTPWLKREAVAHEFMHPFVAALKMSNKVLYDNLIAELHRSNADILEHVDNLIKEGTYKPEERNDEALTIFLGKSITEAFTKDGELNPDYAVGAKKRLIDRFIDWVRNIIDYLTGKRGKINLETFVKNANTDVDAQRDFIRSAIKEVPALQDIYNLKHKSDLIKTINYVKRNAAEAFEKDGSLSPEFEKGVDSLAKKIDEEQHATAQKAANLQATVHERPEGENPVYKTTVNGEERFIQRQENLGGVDQWFEVVKRNGVWEAPNGKTGTEADGLLGDTKAEALSSLGKEIKTEPIDKEKLADVVSAVSDFLQQKSNGRFEFIIEPNENTDVRFDQSDSDHIKVYIDPNFAQDTSAADVLIRYGTRDLFDQDAVEEFTNLVQRNYYQRGDTKTKERTIGVGELNPFMKLQDVSDFMVTQLYENGLNYDSTYALKIKYTNPELEAIDELEAYMELTEPEAKRLRDNIIKKLPQLKDTADVRLKSEILKSHYNILHRLSLDESDTDFVLKYIERAGIGIHVAWRKFNELRQDLKDPDISAAKINRLNKDMEVIKQLVGFYDDFSKLYHNYDEYFNNDQLVKFAKAVDNWQRIRDDINNVSINLAVKWMLPYAEKHNTYIKKQGFTDPKYLVTEETLYNNFKYGVAKDTNFITYNLGANITSRDPVNAIFTNIVADMLSVNNIKIVSDSFDINEAYAQFLKDHNISNGNTKAQEEFYKNNYLRKAEIVQSVYNEATGEFEDKYISKWALHQEYFFDKYQKDYEKEREKYKNPRDGEEAERFAEALNKWQQDNNYGKSEKYRNHEYTKLQNDRYFKLLEHHYNVNNQKYGENHLQFGIIPQKYDVGVIERLKRIINGTKTAKGLYEIRDKAETHFAGIKKDNTVTNPDNTEYRVIKSHLNQLKDDKNIDLNLHSSIIDMITEATNYSSLKEIQFNAENVRALIDGNISFGIPGRKIGKEDFEGNIRRLQQYRKAKRELKELQKLKDSGEAYDEELYNKLTEQVAKGAPKMQLWDKFSPTVRRSQSNRLNDQLIQFINDTFYGDAVEEQKLGNISLNKAAHYLSLYTSINNMAFNTVAGISNIVIGDAQLVIEAHGGKYFNKKDLAWAVKDYYANMANYIGDLKNPIKSKDTQLSFLLDAIQGEVLDEFGNRISGNIARRMFNPSSLFFFTTVGEHQIQTIGMKAMLRAQKVETTDGKIISLYDAFVADKNGRYKLRKDINFNENDLQQFIRKLHGVNRSLNGNYSDLHKSTLQRKWYGTLLLKFRKYLYEAFRIRYSTERVDYERNTVEHGYLKYFLYDYLYKNFRELPWDKKFAFISNYKNLSDNQKYFVRKAGIELGTFTGLLLMTMALFGGGDGQNKKELTDAQKALLLYDLRLQNDLGMFHVQMPSEAQRQLQSPTASMTTIVAVTNFLGQLYKPTEVYQQSGNGHEAGDNKLLAKFKKLLPVISKFPIDVDSKLGYFDMVNQNIQGVSRKQSH